MAVDAKKHTTIAAGEKPTRLGLANAILSIDDVVPVANATEANQVATAVAASGQTLATDPLTVSRTDARGLHRIEYTYDGSVFIPASGVLSFTTLSNATSWAVDNSSYLTAGDKCNIAGAVYWWTGSAWVPSADSGPHVVFSRTTAFNFTNTHTVFTFGSSPVEGSLGGALTTSDYGTFTCALPGVYQVSAVVTATTNPGAPVQIELMKNGGAVRTCNALANNTAWTSVELVHSVRLASGDTIRLETYCNTGTVAGVPGASLNNVCIDYMRP